jgi:HEAT repeat protein
MLLAVGLGVASSAAAPSRGRAEASQAIAQLLAGGNAGTALSRIQYAGQEVFAAAELETRWPQLAEPRARREVATVLAGLGAKRTEPLFISWLDDADATLRMLGAQGLGRLRSARGGRLVPLLADGNSAVRREAARALGSLKDPRHGPALIKAAGTEGEPEVRAVMLISVGQSGHKHSAKALAGFLAHSSEATREAAVRALCLLGDARGFEQAKQLLASPDKFVRRKAVGLLEGAERKRARPLLLGALEDQDLRTAAQAARVLHLHGEPGMVEWLVLGSHRAAAEDKLAYEEPLEKLLVTSEQRQAILRKMRVAP